MGIFECEARWSRGWRGLWSLITRRRLSRVDGEGRGSDGGRARACAAAPLPLLGALSAPAVRVGLPSIPVPPVPRPVPPAATGPTKLDTEG